MTDLTAPFLLRDGNTCDLYDPQPNLFAGLDVAATLASINRWGGNTRHRYTVAEHSLLVAALVPDHLQRAALVHDAGEAVTGDICRPLRAAFPALDLICDEWQDAANEYFQLELTGLDIIRLNLADDVATAIEARHLLKHSAATIKRNRLPDPDQFPDLSNLFGLCHIVSQWAEIWDQCLYIPKRLAPYFNFIPPSVWPHLQTIRRQLDDFKPPYHWEQQ